MLKRIIAAVLLLGVMLLLTACGKFTCGTCGEQKSGKKHTVDSYGVKMTICDDCYRQLGPLGGLLGIQ